ncbi:MAG: hypothetical protein PHS34_09735 [Candidatus Omnitrophica bacterium]|jgi:hypothetical protein|nr:hypothetical protein [Candidatus Omnitrophota bacterium]
MDNVDLIVARIEDLKEHLINRLDGIEKRLDNVVTKSDCEARRANCVNPVQKAELDIKKVTLIGGVITGTITALVSGVITIIKLLG